jgi:ADP-heptose:LPS heptosyltransferase
MLPFAAAATRRPATGDPRRILIVQPDHLGDIILSEPAVRFLRHHLPDHELIAVVGPWSEEIARLAWPVDRIETVSFPGFERAGRGSGRLDPYRRLQQAARRLAALNAAHALVLRDDAWWAGWLARLSTSGQVVTADDAHTRRFATLTIPLVTHRVEQSLQIARAFVEGVTNSGRKSIGDSIWDMSPRVVPRGETGELAGAQAVAPPYLVVHPGTGAAIKTWPERNWRALLGQFAPRRVVITGGAAEQAICERLADGLGHATSFAGGTTLDSLAAVLAGAALAIGTDNGPMHLAAALGTPTVRLFGPSTAERYGPPPGSSRHVILTAGWSCPRCGDLSQSRSQGCGCMTAITPEAVLAAVEKLLGYGA